MKIYNISCLIVTLITTSTVFAKSENLDGVYTFIPGDYKPIVVYLTKTKRFISKNKNHQKVAIEVCNQAVNDLFIRDSQPNLIKILGNNLTFKFPNPEFKVSWESEKLITVEPIEGGMPYHFFIQKGSNGNLTFSLSQDFGLNYFIDCDFDFKKEY